MYTTSWINYKLFIYFENWVHSSGQHFCSELQRDAVCFLWHLRDLLGRGSQRGRWLAVLCAWVKRLRCTNKTATHTDSRDAYRPLRGCLTAGEVALAGHIPQRLHTYCTYLFTVLSMKKQVFSYQANTLLFGLLQTKGALSRFFQGCEKMGRKMRALTNNSLYLSLPLPSIFSLLLSLCFVPLEWWASPLSSGWHSKPT